MGGAAAGPAERRHLGPRVARRTCSQSPGWWAGDSLSHTLPGVLSDLLKGDWDPVTHPFPPQTPPRSSTCPLALSGALAPLKGSPSEGGKTRSDPCPAPGTVARFSSLTGQKAGAFGFALSTFTQNPQASGHHAAPTMTHCLSRTSRASRPLYGADSPASHLPCSLTSDPRRDDPSLRTVPHPETPLCCTGLAVDDNWATMVCCMFLGCATPPARAPWALGGPSSSVSTGRVQAAKRGLQDPAQSWALSPRTEDQQHTGRPGQSYPSASSQFSPKWMRKVPPGAWSRWGGLRTPARPAICPDSQPVCPAAPPPVPPSARLPGSTRAHGRGRSRPACLQPAPSGTPAGTGTGGAWPGHLQGQGHLLFPGEAEGEA